MHSKHVVDLCPSRLAERQKKTSRDTLLKGVELPQMRTAPSLMEPRDPPSAPVQHGHEVMEFIEPENREGEPVFCHRGKGKGPKVSFAADTGRDVPGTSSTQAAHDWQGTQHSGWFPFPQSGPSYSAPAPYPVGWTPSHPSMVPNPQYQSGWTPSHPSTAPNPLYQSGWTPYQPPPAPYPPHQSGWFGPPPPAPNPQSQGGAVAPSASAAAPPARNRHREWRQQKAAQEDFERMTSGEPQKKRLAKDDYHYLCKTCGQSKNKTTGHTQLRGKWYCPASGLTIEEWKSSL